MEISVLDLNAHYRCVPGIKHLKVSEEEEKSPRAPKAGYMSVMHPTTLAVMQQYLSVFAECTDAWLKPFSSALVN